MTAATPPDTDHLIALAERLANIARVITMRHFRAPLDIEAKADESPVTVADRETETALREILAAEVPGHGIYGEEHGTERIGAETVWVLDPIDGTKSFVVGRPLFGTLIAALRNGRPVLGLIDCPALNERWLGVAGQPTLFNGRPVRARDCARLTDAWMGATSPDMFKGDDAKAFARLCSRVRHTVFGGDCHSYGLIALGSLDLVVEADMEPYDYLALAPVIEGAGGRITDWAGKPLDLGSDGRILAAGDPKLHAAAQSALAG